MNATRQPVWRKLLYALLWALATVHVVWFYLCHTRSYMNLTLYEQGLDKTPFQYRMLMMLPLRLASHSAACAPLAQVLSAQTAWFPVAVRAEDLAQAAIDILAVAASGLVARAIYRRASPTGVLAGYAYPLTLAMVLCTYGLLNIDVFRFVYDLPSLFFFSAGLLAIYTRAHPLWLVAIFTIGTTNRETTLFLLPLLVLAERARPLHQRRWRQTGFLTVTLSIFWTGWHLWVVHRFQHNPSAAGSRIGLNLALLAMPLAWPQLCAVFGYVLPLVLAYRGSLRDPVLRNWLRVLPLWFVFMLYYGVFMEIRIFGELVPLVACSALLIAEDRNLHSQPAAPETLAAVSATL